MLVKSADICQCRGDEKRGLRPDLGPVQEIRASLLQDEGPNALELDV